MPPKRASKKVPKAAKSSSSSQKIRFRAPTPASASASTPPLAPPPPAPATPAAAIAPTIAPATIQQAIAVEALEYVPRATSVRLPTPPPLRRPRPIHDLTIDIRVYLDLEEVTSKCYTLSLFQEGRKGWLEFSTMAEQAIADQVAGEKLSRRIKCPNKWRGWSGAQKSRRRSDIFPVNNEGWAEFEELLYIGKSKSAVVQVIFGFDLLPNQVPEIPLDRPKPPKEPKATLVKKVDMGSSDEAEAEAASKSKNQRPSATKTLLEADNAEKSAMGGTIEGVYSQLYNRWICDDLSCPFYNKGGGGCWIFDGQHFSLQLSQLKVWARKILAKIDDCNLEEPYQQLRHELFAQALKDAKRKATQKQKRDNRGEPSSSASASTPNPYQYHLPAPAPPIYWHTQPPWGGSPYYPPHPLLYDLPSGRRSQSNKRRRRSSSSSIDDRANIKLTKWIKDPQRESSKATAAAKAETFDLTAIRDSSPLRAISPRRSKTPSPSKPAPIRPTSTAPPPSSPLRENIDINTMWEEFKRWLRERIHQSRWNGVDKVIQVARFQEVSIEDLRTINYLEAKEFDILWGPLQLVKAKTTEFKVYYKKQLDLAGRAKALPPISEGGESSGEDQDKEDYFEAIEEEDRNNHLPQNPFENGREGEVANYTLLDLDVEPL